MVCLDDLMYGNLLLYRGEQVKLVLIGPIHLTIETRSGENHIPSVEETEGIPLTIDLMQKMGWIAGESMAGMTVCAPKRYSDDWLVFNEDGQIKWVDAKGGQPIQYLHELQNIYYWTHRKHLPV